MSEKLGVGIGVPFTDRLVAAPSTGPRYVDGYYYQYDSADPRTDSGWILGPNLHDGGEGDTTTGYAGAPGTVIKRMMLLVAKQSGMLFNAVLYSPGFVTDHAQGLYFASNDLTNWTMLVFDLNGPTPFGTGTFTYFANGIQNGHSTSHGPFKYIAWTHQDRGGPCQIGCSDIRIRSDDLDVGP